MKNTENIRELLHAMNGFALAYDCLRSKIDKYERDTGASVNDLPGFTESYPFDKSFDELAVDQWIHHTVEKVRQATYKVLNYEYMNTGGNCMVGIFEVWLPERKQTAYVLVNEEGANLSAVDYISNELELEDYDECTIDSIDWGLCTGHEKYFELYKHCLNEYTKSDCKYFGITRQLPFHLLSDELQSQITNEYQQWMDANEYDLFETNGEKVFYHLDFEDDLVDRQLTALKAFKAWHDCIAGDEDYYMQSYTLTMGDKSVKLGFFAHTWECVDRLLAEAIEEW